MILRAALPGLREKKGGIQLGKAEIVSTKKFDNVFEYCKNNDTALKTKKNTYCKRKAKKNGNSMMILSRTIVNIDDEAIFGFRALN